MRSEENAGGTKKMKQGGAAGQKPMPITVCSKKAFFDIWTPFDLRYKAGNLMSIVLKKGIR